MEMIERRKRNRGQGGFTLVELLVVIAILAVLGGVAVFAVGNLTGESKTAACQAEFNSVQTAILAAGATNEADDATDFLEGNPDYWDGNLTASGSPSSSISGLTDRAACETATLP
jgi:prepilin-type N-terminal cleavage/methylation domain-containing protein